MLTPANAVDLGFIQKRRGHSEGCFEGCAIKVSAILPEIDYEVGRPLIILIILYIILPLTSVGTSHITATNFRG